MKTKWLKVLLVGSFALNIAFLTNFVFNNSTASARVEWKESEFTTDYKLSESQKHKIKEIMKKFRISLVKTKSDILEKKIEIIEWIGDSESEYGDIQQQIQDLNDLENQINFTFVDSLIKISDILDSKQRMDLLLNISKHWLIKKKRDPKRGFR